MRILVNAAPLFRVLTGVGRYTRSLYAAMEKLDGVTVDYFHNGRVYRDMPSQAESLAGGWVPVSLRHAARQVKLAYVGSALERTLLRGQYSIYHETGAFPEYRRKVAPSVITIYDMSLITHRSCHPADRVSHFNRNRHRLESVDHVITLSRHVKREIVDLLQFPSDKVTPISLAPGDAFLAGRPEGYGERLQRAGIDFPYVLAVGTMEPRKNLARVIRAMRNVPSHVRLVCAGWPGWLNEECERELAKPDLKDRVVVCNHVSDELLRDLYAGAISLVYASLYEGFGLPIVEAMASGCPVICSDRPSMDEVSDGGARLVDPEDENAIAAGIRDVIENQALREELIEAGRRISAGLSWAKTAEETLAVFRRVNPDAEEAKIA